MNIITKRRKELQYTQAELAEISGIPLRTIQKYENGENSIENMTLKTAAAVAKALAIKIDYLYKYRNGVSTMEKMNRDEAFAKLYVTLEKMAEEQGRGGKFVQIAAERPYHSAPKTQFTKLHEKFAWDSKNAVLKDRIGDILDEIDLDDFSDKPLSDAWVMYKYKS